MLLTQARGDKTCYQCGPEDKKSCPPLFYIHGNHLTFIFCCFQSIIMNFFVMSKYQSHLTIVLTLHLHTCKKHKRKTLIIFTLHYGTKRSFVIINSRRKVFYLLLLERKNRSSESQKISKQKLCQHATKRLMLMHPNSNFVL